MWASEGLSRHVSGIHSNYLLTASPAWPGITDEKVAAVGPSVFRKVGFGGTGGAPFLARISGGSIVPKLEV